MAFLRKKFFRKRTSAEVTIAATMCLAFAVLLTGSAVFALQKARIFGTSAVATSAEVVELVREELPESGHRRFFYDPVFQYKVNGTVFENRADRRSLTERLEFSVGDTTTVYYNPENPTEIRNIPRSEIPKMPTVLGLLASVAWFLFGIFLLHSVRLSRFESSLRARKGSAVSESECTFIALEATSERMQNARMVKLVCSWVHPETGTEFLLRSASLHPARLPSSLQIGTKISCRVDFNDPTFYEVTFAA